MILDPVSKAKVRVKVPVNRELPRHSTPSLTALQVEERFKLKAKFTRSFDLQEKFFSSYKHKLNELRTERHGPHFAPT